VSWSRSEQHSDYGVRLDSHHPDAHSAGGMEVSKRAAETEKVGMEDSRNQ
jgi:hypothetical protein